MPSDFNHALYTDSNLRLTSSVWDDNVAGWMMRVQNYVMSSGGVIWIPDSVDASGNKKVSVKDSALPTGAATEATITSILAKIIAAPSTAANQATIIAALTDIKGYVDGLEGYTDGLEALIAALNGYVDGLEGKDFATQTTLASILTKLADPASQTTLASILAKIITAPSTEAKQDTLIGHVDGIETLLTALNGYVDGLEGYTDGLEAALATLNGKDFATQTTLAAILAKLSADPATQTTLAAILTQLGTTGLKKIIDPLPAGTAIIGKIGIDQTTPGTTNAIAMTSSIESVVTAPVVGSKSVTTTAAEIFAGASIKASRRKLIIRNEDPILRLRIGPSSVTQQNGFPIEPVATAIIMCDPATAVPVYGISEGAALNIAVWEV